MEKVKKTKEHTIFKKNSGRYCVQNNESKWVNGEEKIKILVEQKLIKVNLPKPKEEPVVEAPAESVEASAPETTTEA